MNKSQIVEHITEHVNYSIFDVKWIPSTAKFISIGCTTSGAGVVEVFEMNENRVDSVAKVSRSKAIKSCSFGASNCGRKLAIGDFVGGLHVIDLEYPEKPSFSAPHAHNDIINAMDACGGVSQGAPEIVTGSRDGSVKVWDIRQENVPVANISPAAGSRDCWTVAFGNSFNNDERVVAAGYDNGDVKLFDLRRMSTVWETNLRNGVCSIEFDRRDIQMNKLAAVTLEGGLCVFDMRTLNKEKGFAACTAEPGAGQSVGSGGVISGGKSTVWVVKHLPQNRDIFATCSGSGSIRLWKYNYPEKRSRPGTDGGGDMGVPGSLSMLKATTLTTQPVNSFDWNADMQGLAVCAAFDQTIRVLIATRLNLH